MNERVFFFLMMLVTVWKNSRRELTSAILARSKSSSSASRSSWTSVFICKASISSFSFLFLPSMNEESERTDSLASRFFPFLRRVFCSSSCSVLVGGNDPLASRFAAPVDDDGSAIPVRDDAGKPRSESPDMEAITKPDSPEA